MTDAEAPPALEFVFAAQVTVDRPLDLGDVGRALVSMVAMPNPAGSIECAA